MRPWTQVRAAIANVQRHHGSDDPRLPELRSELRAARAEDYIRRLVDDAPPLTADQRARLAVALLQPSDRGAAAT